MRISNASNKIDFAYRVADSEETSINWRTTKINFPTGVAALHFEAKRLYNQAPLQTLDHVESQL